MVDANPEVGTPVYDVVFKVCVSACELTLSDNLNIATCTKRDECQQNSFWYFTKCAECNKLNISTEKIVS